MLRLLALALFLAACSESPVLVDAWQRPIDARPEIDSPPFVPPPPSHDAGPPPMMACSDAGTCELPPSTCLDGNYLIYYTSGSCNNGSCAYTEGLLYCFQGCQEISSGVGGCSGGFT